MRSTGRRGGGGTARNGPEPSWHVGVDLGGTWVRVAARDPRGRRGALRRRSRGLDALPDLLRAAWRRWGLRPRAVGGLVVATRGIWAPAEQRTAARPLARLARRVRVVPDAQAAHHGALDGLPGVLLLAGTGSIAVGRDGRGRFARAGGLGPLVGDEGSAFWIGREWLRARLAEGRLGRGPRFAAAHRRLTAPDAVARIAALAPAVLRQARRGDPTARRIVAAAQAALASLVVALAGDLRLPSPLPVSWAGSLLAAPGFRAGVWRAVRRRGLRVRPRPPRATAVEAALRMAAVLGGGVRPRASAAAPGSGGRPGSGSSRTARR